MTKDTLLAQLEAQHLSLLGKQAEFYASMVLDDWECYDTEDAEQDGSLQGKIECLEHVISLLNGGPTTYTKWTVNNVSSDNFEDVDTVPDTIEGFTRHDFLGLTFFSNRKGSIRATEVIVFTPSENFEAVHGLVIDLLLMFRQR